MTKILASIFILSSILAQSHILISGYSLTQYEGVIKGGTEESGWGVFSVKTPKSPDGIYRFGNRYEGEFLGNKINGLGQYSFTNGDKYIGEFINGNYHGQGIFSFKYGDTKSGTWVRGKFVGFEKENEVTEYLKRKYPQSSKPKYTESGITDLLNKKYTHSVATAHTKRKYPQYTKAKDKYPDIISKNTIVPPVLKMSTVFVEPNDNKFLDAGEKGKVKVSITNSGKGSATDVNVKLQAESRNSEISFESSKIIGEIPAGKTKTVEIVIRASKEVQRTENIFTISATESQGFPPDPIKITFETYPIIPPKLELVDFGINTATSSNVIIPGVETEVQVRIQNRGQGAAEKINFKINIPANYCYFSQHSKQNYSFPSLKPGGFKDLKFVIIPMKTVQKIFTVSISFTEESTAGELVFELEVEKPQKSIQQMVFIGRESAKADIPDVGTITVDIEKNIPNSNREGEHDLAVVFGIEDYKNIPPVTFAKRDAFWMKKYLENVLGIPENQIYYKTNSEVGQAEFNKVFSEDGWLEKRIKDGKSNVFVYYAGHGAPDLKANKTFLVPHDGDPNYASQTGYGMDKLYSELGKMNAKSVIVFLDACFSGASRNHEMLLADARPILIEFNKTAVGNVTVFSAAGGKEIASSWPEKKHGLFSYFLMKGMRGNADANGDSVITVGELGDYVHENVSYMAGRLDREQTPVLQTMDREKVLISY